MMYNNNEFYNDIPSSITYQNGLFIAGWYAGEVWFLNEKNGERFKLCDAGRANFSEYGVCLISCFGRYLFIGEKTSRKHPLRIFDVDRILTTKDSIIDAEKLLIDIEADGKQRGLCAISSISDEYSGPVFLLACGHGIGTAHIWKFSECENQGHMMKYLGKLNAAGNTILAMQFSSCGSFLVTITSDEVAQKWKIPSHFSDADSSATFDIKAKEGQRVAVDMLSLTEAFGGEQMLSSRLLSKFNRSRIIRDVPLWLKEAENVNINWGKLFPPRLLDPLAYDGDVDDQGIPHGFGTQAVNGDANRIYYGDWKHGLQNGRGQLIDERSDTIVYTGMWKNGVRHGFGHEMLSASGEEYTGFFQNGKRSGLGILILSNKDSLLESTNECIEKRVHVVGFFNNGERHGLSWNTFGKDCPAVPFAITPGSIQHILPIRCIMQYTHGEFSREFGYHRVDGQSLTNLDHDLFNFKSSKKAKCFSINADGHWDRPECWACLNINLVEVLEAEKLDEHQKALLVCNNSTCRMRVHSHCLGHPLAKRCFLWNRLYRFYCDDAEDDQIDDEDQPQPANGIWYCPMPSCQKLANHFAKGIQNSDEVTASNGMDLAEKSKDVKNNGIKKGKITKLKNKKTRKKKKLEFASSINIESRLESITNIGIQHIYESNEVRQYHEQGRPLQYYNHHGNSQLIMTDVDLAEAIEEAFLADQAELHLYEL